MIHGCMNQIKLSAQPLAKARQWNASAPTITAVPEPSTYLAATGLVALVPWPLCRRKRGKVSPGGAIPAVQGADG